MKEERLREAEDMSAATGAFYCLMADASALVVRASIQFKGNIKHQLKMRLPKSVRSNIKRMLRLTGSIVIAIGFAKKADALMTQWEALVISAG